MRKLVFTAVLATLTSLVFAGFWQVWRVEQRAACERPQEEWTLQLNQLKEDGVIRVTETSYDGWTVTLTRTTDDMMELIACREISGKQECYEQQYMRRFGNSVAEVSK